MSYNPVSTDSRSNSPVPFASRNRQYRTSTSHGPFSTADDPSASSAVYTNLLPHPTDAERLSSIPSQRYYDQSSSPRNSHLHPQQQTLYQPPPLPQDPFTNDNRVNHVNPLQNSNNNSRSSFSSGLNQPDRPFAAAMRTQQRSAHGTHSSIGSYDGRRDRSNTSINSSTNRSSQNLSPAHDANYNLTQSDMTIEGLAERWRAYQAWWAKQYSEQPFYRIWTKSKWILFFSAVLLLTYSCAALAISLGYILGHFEYSVVVLEFHANIIYITLAGSIVGIVTALVGLVGIFRENRIWLSWYNVMLWPVFALYLSIGYISFRRAKNHLRQRLRDEWTHSYTREQRLLVQRNLKCCGYLDPFSNGAYDLRCFPLTNLPGCQHKYNIFEDKLLTICWSASFLLAPVQLFVMISALLCSNHVDGMLRSGRPGLKSFKEK